MDTSISLHLYIVEGANPGFIYQVEAFDPEDTSRKIPLGVSVLIWKRWCLSALGYTQEPAVLSLGGVGLGVAIGGMSCPLPNAVYAG